MRTWEERLRYGRRQDSMEGKARVRAGCKREGREETEIAVRPL